MIDYNPALFEKKRELLGLTRKQLADECKVAVGTIYNIEAQPSKSTASITLLIGLVLDWLADEQGKLDEFYILEGE